MEAQAAGEVRHWTADVNGISLHVAERAPSTGPAVLLIHGFPELWLSWRHQMAALAARGFHALAPDLRGYGDSSVPTDPAAYSVLHIVGDLVALLDHLRLPKVFVVGHDWGALVAWHLCLFRPDRVRAAVVLRIPYFPRGPRPMTDSFAKLGDGFYINQSMTPLRAYIGDTFLIAQASKCILSSIPAHLYKRVSPPLSNTPLTTRDFSLLPPLIFDATIRFLGSIFTRLLAFCFVYPDGLNYYFVYFPEPFEVLHCEHLPAPSL